MHKTMTLVGALGVGAGLVYLARSQSRNSHASADATLVERVRARMGHHISHPRAVEVTAHQGYVTLRGAIPDREVTGLVAAVSRVPGVREVLDELESDMNTSVSPQREIRPAVEASERSWAPPLKLVAGIMGVVAAAYVTQAVIRRRRQSSRNPRLKSPLWASLQQPRSAPRRDGTPPRPTNPA
jgi:hypothetical protein